MLHLEWEGLVRTLERLIRSVENQVVGCRFLEDQEKPNNGDEEVRWDRPTNNEPKKFISAGHTCGGRRNLDEGYKIRGATVKVGVFPEAPITLPSHPFIFFSFPEACCRLSMMTSADA
jgi:hypothetical protein